MSTLQWEAPWSLWPLSYFSVVPSASQPISSVSRLIRACMRVSEWVQGRKWGKREDRKRQKSRFLPEPIGIQSEETDFTWTSPRFNQCLFWKQMPKTREVYLLTFSRFPTEEIHKPLLEYLGWAITTSSLVDFQSQTFGTTGSPDLPFHHDKWQWVTPDEDRLQANKTASPAMSTVRLLSGFCF